MIHRSRQNNATPSPASAVPGGSSIWLELRSQGRHWFFELPPDGDTAVTVGAGNGATVRIAARGVAPIHLYFERVGSAVHVVPVYGRIRVNSTKAAAPQPITRRAVIDLGGASLDAVLHDHPPSARFESATADDYGALSRSAAAYVEDLPETSEGTAEVPRVRYAGGLTETSRLTDVIPVTANLADRVSDSDGKPLAPVREQQTLPLGSMLRETQAPVIPSPVIGVGTANDRESTFDAPQQRFTQRPAVTERTSPIISQHRDSDGNLIVDAFSARRGDASKLATLCELAAKRPVTAMCVTLLFVIAIAVAYGVVLQSEISIAP